MEEVKTKKTGKAKASTTIKVVEELEDNDVEPLWVQQYVFIKTLMHCLNMKDLTSAAQACKLWSEVSRTVRKKRSNKPFVFLYHPEANMYPADFHSQMPTGFTSYEPFENSVLQGFQNFSEPQFIFMIRSENMKDTVPFGEVIGDINVQTEEKVEEIFPRFPPNIPSLAAVVCGIISEIPSTPLTVEVETPGAHPMAACLAIPKVPGLKIKTFTVDTLTLKAETAGVLGKTKIAEVWKENYLKVLNIEPGDNVKGIMVFMTDISAIKQKFILAAVHELIRQNPKTAMGGGLIFTSVKREVHGEPFLATGLLICSDDEELDVRAGSTAMYDRRVTDFNRSNLLKFKREGMDGVGTDSFAVMFACNGRGEHMHGANGVESALLRSYYPNTKVIGAFTMGEFVHENISDFVEEEVQVPDKVSDLCFSFTTAVVFVSWKKRIVQ